MAALDFSSLKTELKRGPSGGYLLCGEEAYLISHSLKLIRSAVLGDGADAAFNHIKIDASAPGEYDVGGSICELPVFAEKRLVELHSFDISHMKADELKSLCAAFALLEDNPQTVLVMVSTPYELDMSGYPKRPPKQFVKLTEHITPVVFMRESPAALCRWIMNHFRHEGLNCETRTAEALLAYSGSDMFTLSGEIAKLCAFLKANGRDTLTPDDIKNVASHVPTIDSFDFPNAVLNRDFDRAMYILADKKKHKEEPTVLLADVTRTYARMEQILTLATDAATPAEIAKKLKMHEYPVKNHLAAAKRLGEKKLAEALRLCGETDYKMKFSQIDSYVLISRLLSSLSML